MSCFPSLLSSHLRDCPGGRGPGGQPCALILSFEPFHVHSLCLLSPAGSLKTSWAAGERQCNDSAHDLSTVQAVPDPTALTRVEHGFGPREQSDFAENNVNVGTSETRLSENLSGWQIFVPREPAERNCLGGKVMGK